MWIVIGVIILVIIIVGLFFWFRQKTCKDKFNLEWQIEQLEGDVSFWKGVNEKYFDAVKQTEYALDQVIVLISNLIYGEPEDCIEEIQQLSQIININGQLATNLSQLEAQLQGLNLIFNEMDTWRPEALFSLFKPETNCLLESDLIVGLMNLIEMELIPQIAAIPSIQETNSAEIAAANMKQSTISQVNNAAKGPLAQCDPLKLAEYRAIQALARATGAVAQTAEILPAWQQSSFNLLSLDLASALVTKLII